MPKNTNFVILATIWLIVGASFIKDDLGTYIYVLFIVVFVLIIFSILRTDDDYRG